MGDELTWELSPLEPGADPAAAAITSGLAAGEPSGVFSLDLAVELDLSVIYIYAVCDRPDPRGVKVYEPWMKPRVIQSLSQASLPGLRAWAEIGGITSSLCREAQPLQPITIWSATSRRFQIPACGGAFASRPGICCWWRCWASTASKKAVSRVADRACGIWNALPCATTAF